MCALSLSDFPIRFRFLFLASSFVLYSFDRVDGVDEQVDRVQIFQLLHIVVLRALQSVFRMTGVIVKVSHGGTHWSEVNGVVMGGETPSQENSHKSHLSSLLPQLG